MTTSAPLPAMSETIFYVTTLLADRPRAIDKLIDYFGDPPRGGEVPLPRATSLPASW
jgi:hypothetical protein